MFTPHPGLSPIEGGGTCRHPHPSLPPSRGKGLAAAPFLMDCRLRGGMDGGALPHGLPAASHLAGWRKLAGCVKKALLVDMASAWGGGWGMGRRARLEMVMERPTLKPIGSSSEGLDTPALVVDLDALEANIAAVHSHFESAGAGLRPNLHAHLMLGDRAFADSGGRNGRRSGGFYAGRGRGVQPARVRRHTGRQPGGNRA